jgi:hypothetical protein
VTSGGAGDPAVPASRGESSARRDRARGDRARGDRATRSMWGGGGGDAPGLLRADAADVGVVLGETGRPSGLTRQAASIASTGHGERSCGAGARTGARTSECGGGGWTERSRTPRARAARSRRRLAASFRAAPMSRLDRDATDRHSTDGCRRDGISRRRRRASDGAPRDRGRERRGERGKVGRVAYRRSRRTSAEPARVQSDVLFVVLERFSARRRKGRSSFALGRRSKTRIRDARRVTFVSFHWSIYSFDQSKGFVGFEGGFPPNGPRSRFV